MNTNTSSTPEQQQENKRAALVNLVNRNFQLIKEEFDILGIEYLYS